MAKRSDAIDTSHVTGEIKWVGPTLAELPQEQRAFVVRELAKILAQALVADFKANPPEFEPQRSTQPEETQPPSKIATPWLTVRQGAARAQAGPRVIYRAVRAGQLRAVRVGGTTRVAASGRIHRRLAERMLCR